MVSAGSIPRQAETSAIVRAPGVATSSIDGQAGNAGTGGRQTASSRLAA
jgi:hypothetical protein